MKCGELCTRDVAIATERDNIADVAKLMRELHVGSVVITRDDAGRKVPVGIITDRDIVVELVAKSVSAETCMAGDIINRKLLTISDDASVWDALTRMRAEGVRRLPVVDKQSALVGILAADDLIEFVRDQVTQLTALIRREQNTETRQRR